jgi:hypothetical protein
VLVGKRSVGSPVAAGLKGGGVGWARKVGGEGAIPCVRFAVILMVTSKSNNKRYVELTWAYFAVSNSLPSLSPHISTV